MRDFAVPTAKKGYFGDQPGRSQQNGPEIQLSDKDKEVTTTQRVTTRAATPHRPESAFAAGRRRDFGGSLENIENLHTGERA